MRTLKRLLLRQQSFFTHCNRVEGNIKGVHEHAWSWLYPSHYQSRLGLFHPLVTCAARRTKKDLAPSSCEERDKILDNPAATSLDAIPSPFTVHSSLSHTIQQLSTGFLNTYYDFSIHLQFTHIFSCQHCFTKFTGRHTIQTGKYFRKVQLIFIANQKSNLFNLFLSMNQKFLRLFHSIRSNIILY